MSPILWQCLLIPLIAAAPSHRPQRIGFHSESKNSDKPQWDSSLTPRTRYDNYLLLTTFVSNLPRAFRLCLNTASNRTFVAKVGFPKGTSITSYYDPKKSQTSKFLNQSFVYEDGRILATGQLYEDRVAISNIIDRRIVFGAITQLSGAEYLYADGQLGLAWTPYGSDTDTPIPIIHTMLNGKPQRVFQLYSKPPRPYRSMLEIKIGETGIRECAQHETFWFPLLKGPQVPMLTVNSFEIQKFHYVVSHRALFDSSVGSVFLPKNPFAAVLKAYDAKFNLYLGAYLAPCSNNKHEWTVTIGSHNFQIIDKYVLKDEKWHSGRCALMIEKSEYIDNEEVYRFGMPFFFRYCATFDVGNNRLGFSESVEKMYGNSEELGG